MKKAILIFVLILSLCLAGCGKKPVMLEYKATQGDPVKYNFSLENKATAEGEGADKAEAILQMLNMSLTMTVSQKITDGGEGLLSQDMTIESGTITMGEKETAIENKEEVSVKIKKNGEIVESSEDLQGLTSNAVFPDKAVLPGDTWTNKIKIPVMGQDMMEIETNYTFEKFETIGEQECAVIKFVAPETTKEINKATMKLSLEGTTSFAHEKGELAKTDLKIKMFMTDPASNTSLNLEQTMLVEKLQ